MRLVLRTPWRELKRRVTSVRTCGSRARWAGSRVFDSSSASVVAALASAPDQSRALFVDALGSAMLLAAFVVALGSSAAATVAGLALAELATSGTERVLDRLDRSFHPGTDGDAFPRGQAVGLHRAFPAEGGAEPLRRRGSRQRRPLAERHGRTVQDEGPDAWRVLA